MSDETIHRSGGWMAAWHADCARVGLDAPSTDLVEIKRAYAKTLRTTRPDDDARAYQALREAYDRLVAHARNETGRIEALVEGRSDARSEERSEERFDERFDERLHEHARKHGDDQGETSRPRSLEDLCAWIESRVDAGPTAVSQAMPALRDELRHLPLTLTPLASARFADLLIRLDMRAPHELVALLHDEFRWIGDFRVEQMLGSYRIDSLRKALARRRQPPVDEPLVRALAPVVALSRWLESHRALWRWRAWLAIFLMGFTLLAQMTRAGQVLLRRLGVDETDEQEIRRTAMLSHLLHLMLISGVAWGLMRLGGVDPGRANDATGLIFAAAVLSQAAIHGLHLMLALVHATAGLIPDNDRDNNNNGDGGNDAIDDWRRAAPWIGAGAFVLAGVLGTAGPAMHIADRELWGMLIVVSVIGLLLLPFSRAMLTSGMLLFFGLLILFPSLPAIGVGLAAAWVAIGGTVLIQLRYVPDDDTLQRAQPGWPRGGGLAALALGSVGLPVLVAWLSVRCGQRVFVAAFMIAAAVAVALQHRHLPTWPAAFAVPVGVAAMLVAQRLGWQAGRRLMNRLPAGAA